MGVKIGENTLLSGNTILKSGEQVSVSRSSAGDSTAPLAMAVTSASGSPAYDPSWLDDPKGIVNVAMVKKLIELLAAGLTEEQINAIVNLHNSNAAAHSVLFSGKLDKPSGGTTGQVLTRTASGSAWADAVGGSAFDEVFGLTYDSSGPFIDAKDKSKKTILVSHGGWDIIADGQLYVNSYSDNLNLSGYRVIVDARDVLAFSDSTGSYTLADLAGGGGGAKITRHNGVLTEIVTSAHQFVVGKTYRVKVSAGTLNGGPAGTDVIPNVVKTLSNVSFSSISGWAMNGYGPYYLQSKTSPPKWCNTQGTSQAQSSTFTGLSLDYVFTPTAAFTLSALFDDTYTCPAVWAMATIEEFETSESI